MYSGVFWHGAFILKRQLQKYRGPSHRLNSGLIAAVYYVANLWAYLTRISGDTVFFMG
jgi:hypothetical protein